MKKLIYYSPYIPIVGATVVVSYRGDLCIFDSKFHLRFSAFCQAIFISGLCLYLIK